MQAREVAGSAGERKETSAPHHGHSDVEVWLPVPGYGGRYQVSDLGRVRSFVGASPILLSPQRNGKGYVKVPLSLDGKTRTSSVHRLVLEAFVGPCPPGREGAHRDGDNGNNRLSNLGWLTRHENAQEREMHRIARGVPHHSEKVTPELRAAIEAAPLEGGLRAIAAEFGVCAATVFKVRRAAGHVVPRPRKTHCIRGHEFTPENVYLRADTAQACRICRKQRQVERTQRTSAVNEAAG